MPTILVVDDEPAIRMLVSQVLETNGFSVLTAQDGADAISVMQSHRGEIELLITDIRMPRVDGPALVRSLFQGECGIPVLFMSSEHDPSMLDQFETTGFLIKPFSVDRLLEAVRTILGELSLGLVN
jgi:two-component system, cell cycle sensor histidine kinase and response regulator CckA